MFGFMDQEATHANAREIWDIVIEKADPEDVLLNCIASMSRIRWEMENDRGPVFQKDQTILSDPISKATLATDPVFQLMELLKASQKGTSSAPPYHIQIVLIDSLQST